MLFTISYLLTDILQWLIMNKSMYRYAPEQQGSEVDRSVYNLKKGYKETSINGYIAMANNE